MKVNPLEKIFQSSIYFFYADFYQGRALQYPCIVHQVNIKLMPTKKTAAKCLSSMLSQRGFNITHKHIPNLYFHHSTSVDTIIYFSKITKILFNQFNSYLCDCVKCRSFSIDQTLSRLLMSARALLLFDQMQQSKRFQVIHDARHLDLLNFSINSSCDCHTV